MNNRVLVVAAHADDEVLGCGGTISRHVDEGDDVHVVFLADGVSSRSDCTDNELQRRLACAAHAQEILGVKTVSFLGFPDNKLDTVPLLDIVQKLEEVILNVTPSIIYTHHIGDLNIDHQIANKTVLTAIRPQPGSTVKEVYAFEVLSSTDWQCAEHHPFLPNVFVDITAYIENKIKALNAYEMEMREPPHSRSVSNVERLASVRGCSVGLYYAEAFMLIRKIK